MTTWQAAILQHAACHSYYVTITVVKSLVRTPYAACLSKYAASYEPVAMLLHTVFILSVYDFLYVLCVYWLVK